MADQALRDIITKVESAGDARAWRFEPATYARVIVDRDSLAAAAKLAHDAHNLPGHTMTFGTADVLISSSWGLYQIMGYNLYAQGYRDTIFNFLDSRSQQDFAFDRFLAATGHADTTWQGLKSDQTALLNFARIYNGPGNPQNYADWMMQAAAKLGI